MNHRRKLLSLVSVFIMSAIIVLTGCGTENTTETEEGMETSDISIAMVYTGSLGDQSFNDSAHEGAMRAQEDFGVDIKVLEGSSPEEYESNLLAAADEGYDLVIMSSSNFEDYLRDIAPNYPDVKFGIIDTVVEGDNIQSISFAQNEGSFLAGVAAAEFTKESQIEGVNSENIIGFVGGMDIPVIRDFLTGYEQGAKYIDPDIQVLTSFVGSWTDPLRGKELALAQYEQGADIVFSVAAATGTGVLEGAADGGKYAIGVDLNQDNLYPGHILTSMLKRVDTASYKLIEDVVNGEFEGNKTLKLGLDNDGVGLTDFSVMREHLGDDFPEHIFDSIDEAAEKISVGEITVDNAPGFEVTE